MVHLVDDVDALLRQLSVQGLGFPQPLLKLLALGDVHTDEAEALANLER